MNTRSIALCTGIALLVAGCAGRNFVRPSADSLVLGTTTYADVTARMGAPSSRDKLVKNGQTVEAIGYTYANAFGRPDFSNVIPVRGMQFFFLDGVLVGYHFTSTFLGDKTDFDDAKVYQLRKGETTRAQVIELLGRPGGTYAYPLIDNKSETALVYLYRRPKREPFSGRLTMTEKRLVVALDSGGLVTGVELGLPEKGK